MKKTNPHKPVVFYKGDVKFREGVYGTGEYATVYDVIYHPDLGPAPVVYTAEVFKHFDGGFETDNYVYIKMPSEVKKPEKVGLVQDIMNHFDFKQVNTVMKALDWYWVSSNGVPDISNLRTVALRLLEDVEKQLDTHKDHQTGTGGFEASGYMDEKGRKSLSLKFVVEELTVDDF
jgi:hypothetical protein